MFRFYYINIFNISGKGRGCTCLKCTNRVNGALLA